MTIQKNQVINPNGRGDKLAPEQIIDGIQGTGGIKTAICERLGITRPTINSYIKKYPEVQEAMQIEKSKIGDLVESKMYKLIKEEDKTMIIFYAKTQMKDRGYIEKQEIDHGVKGDTDWSKVGAAFAAAVAKPPERDKPE